MPDAHYACSNYRGELPGGVKNGTLSIITVIRKVTFLAEYVNKRIS
jgi:hypothetical protein